FHIVNEDTRQAVENPALKILRSGVVVGLANHTMLLSRDGREWPIDDCGSPIIDDHGDMTGTVLVFRDITQRRQADAALRHAQAQLSRVAQRALLGELAAAIAHEVNAPLAGIMLHASASLRWLAANPPDLDEVRIAAQRTIRDVQRAVDVIAR